MEAKKDNDYWTGFITARSYPMFIPYRRVAENKEGDLIGRTPRILVTVISTLVNAHDPSWDAGTRTLTLADGYRRLAERLGLHNGGNGRALTNGTLEALAGYEYPGPQGRGIRIVEDADLSASRNGRWLRFTPEYVDMLTDDPKSYPLNAFLLAPTTIVPYDLIALACLYGSHERRVLIPLTTLKLLLPRGAECSERRSRLRGAVTTANLCQDDWKITLNKESLAIVPADRYVPLGALVFDLRDA